MSNSHVHSECQVLSGRNSQVMSESQVHVRVSGNVRVSGTCQIVT